MLSLNLLEFATYLVGLMDSEGGHLVYLESHLGHQESHLGPLPQEYLVLAAVG